MGNKQKKREKKAVKYQNIGGNWKAATLLLNQKMITFGAAKSVFKKNLKRSISIPSSKAEF
jgi:hypothetical protein